MLTCPHHWLTNPVGICVIGVGGTGSALVDGLCALDATLRQIGHPGFRITCYDADRVQAHNVGRQRYTPADVGLPKVAVLTHRMGLFYGTAISGVPKHYGPKTRSSADLYITATDSAPFRANFPGWHTGARSALWADLGNGANDAQFVIGSLGRSDAATYIPNVVDLFPELRDAEFQASQQDVPTCSAEEALMAQSFPINRAIAGYLVDLLWQVIRHGSSQHQGVFCSVAPPSVSLIHANTETWAQFGWKPPRKRRAAA